MMSAMMKPCEGGGGGGLHVPCLNFKYFHIAQVHMSLTEFHPNLLIPISEMFNVDAFS